MMHGLLRITAIVAVAVSFLSVVECDQSIKAGNIRGLIRGLRDRALEQKLSESKNELERKTYRKLDEDDETAAPTAGDDETAAPTAGDSTGGSSGDTDSPTASPTASPTQPLLVLGLTRYFTDKLIEFVTGIEESLSPIGEIFPFLAPITESLFSLITTGIDSAGGLFDPIFIEINRIFGIVFPELAGICFSPSTKVEVLGRGEIEIRNLNIGDKVLTASGDYNSVYTISHFNSDKLTQYIELNSISDIGEGVGNFEGELRQPLRLTSNHMLFLHGAVNPVPARLIKVGDILQSIDGPQKVTEVNNVELKGLYNPITTDGTIIADGIVSSTYTSYTGESHIGAYGYSFPFQSIADMAYTPYRIFCTSTSMKFCNNHKELSSLNVMMRMVFRMVWSEQHNDIMKFLVLSVYVGTFGSISWMLQHCFEVAAVLATLYFVQVNRNVKKNIQS